MQSQWSSIWLLLIRAPLWQKNFPFSGNLLCSLNFRKPTGTQTLFKEAFCRRLGAEGTTAPGRPKVWKVMVLVRKSFFELERCGVSKAEVMAEGHFRAAPSWCFTTQHPLPLLTTFFVFNLSVGGISNQQGILVERVKIYNMKHSHGFYIKARKETLSICGKKASFPNK